MSSWETKPSAWSGVLAGLGIAVPGGVEAFVGETAATSLVLAVTPALAVPLLVVLHRGQALESGRFGAVAYLVNLIGLGLFGGAAFSLNAVLFFAEGVRPAAPSVVLLLGSALVFAVGSVLFGASMLRAGVYPPVPVWGYAVLLAVFAVAARLPDGPLTSLLHVLVGVSLVWLAVAVLSRPAVGAAG
ncbi:hypothetical protein ACFFQW_06565 [Umezawaea endophytica]|uniref:Uncharacterized protein n=1 Tax=Umezawaea endophytica TaxID=1654476 RepID=A0A9X2VQH2_9PSEU|nr:hypothetical protein [Umezawaea endophytica]MCS7481008.1 hypothetical protein [Umezawaea endophytica]